MAEPTLALPLKKLESVAGSYLGYGRGANYGETEWTTRQQADITDCVESGLRRFYYPAEVPGEAAGYGWTFLRPHVALTLTQAGNTLAMRDDFGGIEGPLRLYNADRGSWRIDVVDSILVRQKREEFPDQTGRPEIAAVEIVNAASERVTTTSGSRYQLLFFPLADQDYTVQFQYYCNPNSLTATYPWPHGGAEHAETLMAAVRAAAEYLKIRERATEHAYFLDQLKASIARDRLKKSQVAGVMHDPTYNQGRPIKGGRHLIQGDPITWSGT